ncbi:hypothetical protein OQY15_01255 [Pedobacter sp. MC2016-15]|uniref:hypothetical protein n=1 Tax=Pedobacter sp. MC2016-15 TaxID=2994473 RepID=UPI0022486D8C|nr:hypothetical protein [Pedobacter sp. MC2016-15]MCX2477695.1 hypothetical protein [Pedobacter sp. MC2016-15]
MYQERPNFILGFHGCDKSVCETLLNHPDTYKSSKESHDWLGHGIYFWENNHDRALQWAYDKKKRGSLNYPAVIGAILHLGNCCDLTDQESIGLVKSYHKSLEEDYGKLGFSLPKNRDLKTDTYQDMLLRELDCTVLEYMHAKIHSQYDYEIAASGYSNYKVYDSVRGVFTEGGPIYTGAGIFEKSHIQICIRNSNCIKGFFLPRKEKKWPA